MKIIIGDYVRRKEYFVEPDTLLKTVCPFPNKEFAGFPLANNVRIYENDFNKSVKELAKKCQTLCVCFVLKCGHTWYKDTDGFYRSIGG